MSHYILALNCGSSSAKFNLFELMDGSRLNPTVQGIVEEIGNPDRSRLRYSAGNQKHEVRQAVAAHRDALVLIFEGLHSVGIDTGSICAVGHRTVHGGDRYSGSVRIDEKVIRDIHDLIPIAPLHNPPNLTGIEEAMRLLPGVPQVAVFDTAFHASMPGYAFRYAIPGIWYKGYGVRKYGFHGTSHMYVSKRAARLLKVPYDSFNGITAHLGNGCSITKICGGRSMDTSMGFTPLEGVPMGTRSGDLDPALISHVAGCITQNEGIDEAQAYRRVMHALNKESGLKALGGTNLMQDIREKALNGDVEAELVVSLYAYRIAKYIGAYWATMSDCNAIVFTAGVGENEWYVRKKVLSFLDGLQITIDEENNRLRGQEVVIGTGKAHAETPLAVMVIPTDEEIVIGYDALFLGYMGQPVPERYPFEK